MKTKIYEIESVRLGVTGAAKITIRARGKTRTGGWTEPELRPAAAPTPGDGDSNVVTMHYDFVATGPTGMATEALTPIDAERSLPAPGPGKTLKVVVRSETNEKEDSIASPMDPR
jgi:hypothetical protein